MKRNNLLLILVLFYACCIIGCQKPEQKKDAKLTKKKPTSISSSALEKKEIDSLLQELKAKNPFRPDHSAGISSHLAVTGQLKGIIWDSSRPYALIGERVVLEGDIIDGKRVTKINKNSVELDNKGIKEVWYLEGTH